MQVHRIKTHRAARCVPGSRHAGLSVYNTVFQYIDYMLSIAVSSIYFFIVSFYLHFNCSGY